jgi:hypothetical protein
MNARDRKRYEKLDDIGMIGIQGNRSEAEIKRDAARTARFIKAHKTKMKLEESKKKKSTAAKSR